MVPDCFSKQISEKKLKILQNTGNFHCPRNTSWVAPACADCPGFLVLGAAPAPASTLVSEPPVVPMASILLYGPVLALFKSFCNKRQLSRKNKFDKLFGMFPALECKVLGPKHTCFLRSPGPNNLSEQKKGVQWTSESYWPHFVNPLLEGLLNNAKARGHCLALALLAAAPPPPVQKRDAQHIFLQHSSKATKEYLNQRGTKIRVFRALFRARFLPPFSPHFSPLFPLQALSTLPPLLPSSPPLPPPF